MRKRKKRMELKLTVQFDEDKLREIVAEAVEKLKAEGYIYLEGKPLNCALCTEEANSF